MANRIQIRHGDTAPTTSDLLPFELGWDGTSLYINNNQASDEPCLIIGGNGVSIPAGNITGTLGIAHGGTGLNTLTQYALYYASATDALSGISPNTTTTQKFLSMTGNGSAGTAPVWNEVTKVTIGLNNVENTALSTWAGTGNITTLGTITSGTWNGNAISVSKGGTGTTTLDSGKVLLGNGTNAITSRTIVDNTTATAAVNNNNSIVTQNTLYNATANINNNRQTSDVGIYAPTGAGTANQILTSSGGTNAPSWINSLVVQTGSNPDTYSDGIFMVKDKTVDSIITIAANDHNVEDGGANIIIDNEAGYTPIGIVGTYIYNGNDGGGSSFIFTISCFVQTITIDNVLHTVVHWEGRNTRSSQSKFYITAKVLYIKT